MISGETIYINKMQEIIADYNGIISASNNAIYPVEPGKNVFELHPFFLSLKSAIVNLNQIYFTFPCINLQLGDGNYYCDIIIKKEKDFLAVLLFNYSDHYELIQKKSQKIKQKKLKS